MYNVEIGTSKSICFSSDEVANLIFESTGVWQLSQYLREICPKMNVGEVEIIDDADIIVECIVQE